MKIRLLAELLASPLTRVDKLVLENITDIKKVFTKHRVVFMPRDTDNRYETIRYLTDLEFAHADYTSVSGFYITLSPAATALSLRQLEQFIKELKAAEQIILELKDIDIDLIRV